MRARFGVLYRNGLGSAFFPTEIEALRCVEAAIGSVVYDARTDSDVVVTPERVTVFDFEEGGFI